MTQATSAALYAAPTDYGAPAIDGIRFLSRFVAEQELWTVFEQPGDAQRSAYLSVTRTAAFFPSNPLVEQAMSLLGVAAEQA